MENKRKIGGKYEKMAVEYLKKQGYRILEQNYYCRQGEIDIIARDGVYLVFVEVKYRKDNHMGSGLEAVDYRKQRHMYASAQVYLYLHQYGDSMPCRFDVVSFTGDQIQLVQDAFSGF